LLALLIGGGVGYSRLQQPEEEAAARLVGALGFIEQQIERSSLDILDANPYIFPKISSTSSANTFRVAGRVKLLNRDADSGLEGSRVGPYQATVESLCKPYTDKACWRLHALEIEGAAVANHASATKQAGGGADDEPIEASTVESASNEAPEADDTTAAAVTLSDGLLADAALPTAPEPPALAVPSRVLQIGELIAKPADSGPTEAADETQAPRPSDQAAAPSNGDAEQADALALRERPAPEQAAVQESPFATISAAARQAERRSVIAETSSEHAVAAAKAVSEGSRTAANSTVADSGQGALQPAATEPPQDTAIAEPDAAPLRLPPGRFPRVASDRLAASAEDEPIPIPAETRSVASQDRAPAGTDEPTPPASLAPHQPAVAEPKSALPHVAVAARSPATQSTAEPPLTEAERVELEQGLARLGFYPGPVDGLLDQQSEEAIRAYQDFAALPKSGRPDRMLLTELRQLAATVVRLAGDDDQVPAQSGADERAAAAKATLRAMAAAQAKLAEAAPPEPTVSAQPLPSAPPRKPQPASPAKTESSLAANQSAEPKVVASLEARPLAGTPAPPQPPPIAVAFTVDSLPRDIRKAIEAGRLDARLDSGHTPLTAAIVEGRQDAVAALLDHGANPNLSSEDDATALMYAAWAGDVVSVKLLLQSGAAPNHKNLDGKTALMAASATGQSEIAKLLLEAGADPDLQALKGWTALMYAVWRDQTEVVRLLLRHRANISIRNDDDETAVDIAAELSRDDIRVLLVNASGAG
jgi:peptidoglycan hydrolase-like protein with peptidoglycan-binding domain